MNPRMRIFELTRQQHRGLEQRAAPELSSLVADRFLSAAARSLCKAPPGVTENARVKKRTRLSMLPAALGALRARA